MQALAASCEELRARTGNPPLGLEIRLAISLCNFSSASDCLLNLASKITISNFTPSISTPVHGHLSDETSMLSEHCSANELSIKFKRQRITLLASGPSTAKNLFFFHHCMLTSLLENNFFSPPGEDHVPTMFNDSLTNRLSVQSLLTTKSLTQRSSFVA